MLKQLNQFFNDACIDAKLELLGSASGDVRQNPAGLLSYCLLWVAEDERKSGNEVGFDCSLSFIVVTGDNVSHSSKAWNCNCHVFMVHELNQLDKQTRVQEVWDSIFVAIGQVRESPADICDDVVLVVFNQNFYQRWNGSLDMLVVWLGSSTAQV